MLGWEGGIVVVIPARCAVDGSHSNGICGRETPCLIRDDPLAAEEVVSDKCIVPAFTPETLVF